MGRIRSFSYLQEFNPYPKTDMLNTEKAITLKNDQGTIPEGAPLRFHPDIPSRCFVTHAGREWQVRVTSAFNRPSMQELEEWVHDEESRERRIRSEDDG